MLKKLNNIFEKNKLWIIVIFILNIMFGVLLWLIDDTAFIYIFPTMIIGSLILYCTVSFIIYKRDFKRENLIVEFINEPSKDNECKLIRLFSDSERKVIENIGEILRENQTTIQNQNKAMEEYQEYIEAWAHEIKTPLGLMTFVLDNRRDEMSPIVYKKLDYSRAKMQEDIERMLYYARLKACKSDYYLKKLTLKRICSEVIKEYEIILREQKIKVDLNVEDLNIVSDEKGVQFIIRQIISNSIKYKNNEISDPHILIFSYESDRSIKLIIRDNGIGLKQYDLPFIFEKGFTGEVGRERKNSTGMGLYISKQVAEDLKLKLEITENYINGFEIVIVFPKINL